MYLEHLSHMYFPEKSHIVYKALHIYKDDVLDLPLKKVYEFIGEKVKMSSHVAGQYINMFRRFYVVNFVVKKDKESKSHFLLEVNFLEPKYWIKWEN